MANKTTTVDSNRLLFTKNTQKHKPKIIFWQINLNHAFAASNNLTLEVGRMGKTKPIILIQEPYLFKGKPKLWLPNYTIYFKDSNCRSAVAIPSHLTSWAKNDLSDKDTVAVILEENANDKCLVVSSYLDITSNEVIPSKLNSAADFCRHNNLPLLAGIDSNSHSTLWGCDMNNKRGDQVEEFILLQGLSLLNKGNEKTFISSIGSSIIDVSFCSPSILNKVHNWHVDPTYQFSDHRRIIFELDFNHTVEVWGRNLKKVDWNKFRKHLKSSLPRLPYPMDWNKSTIDSSVDSLNKKIKASLDFACPEKKIKVSSKPISWWNADIAYLQLKTRRFHRAFLKNKSSQNHLKYKQTQKEFKMAVKQAKNEAWTFFCDSLQDVKSLSKLSRSLTSDKSGVIGMMATPDGVTKNGSEVLKVLMDCHFPGSTCTPTASDSTDDPTFSRNFVQHANYLSFITNKKVKESFKSFGPTKAAGPDGWKPIILQNLDESTIDFIVMIYKSCLALGHNPKAWTKSKVIFIPKMGKDNYDSPKSFRPISLTDFLYKGLERIVQWELESKYKIQNKMHKMQFAFSKNKSTDGALSQVADKIESGLLRGSYTLACFCDIAGAFDSISIPAIIEGLKRKLLPPYLIKWFRNCLGNRAASATIKNDSITRYLVKGTSQGGVGSPLAWNLGIDDILEKLNKPPFTMVGFADDLCLMVSGNDPDKLVDLTQPLLNELIKLGAEKGLAFNALKTQVVLFTTKKKKASKKLKINNTPIDFSDGAKYLGIFLDEKLTYSKHINDKINKCKQHLFSLKSIIGKKYGPNPHLMRWAYTGIVRPKLTYGCHLWHHKLTKTQITKLDRLNRLCCLSLAPIKKSSPTTGLEIIYNLLPLDLHVQKIALSTRIRIQNQIQPSWDGIGSKLGKSGHLLQCSKNLNLMGIANPPPDKLTTEKCWDENFKVLDFDLHKNDTFESKDVRNVYIYTDGSKVKDSSGYGFHIKRGNLPTIDCHSHLGKIATVFQAEIVAITNAVKSLKKQHKLNVTIRSDSQAAILAIKSNTIKSKVVKECRSSLNHLGKDNNVTLQWIKSHAGHEGNEMADKNAKKGAEEEGFGPEPFLPVPESYSKQNLNLAMIKIWQKRWDSNPEFCKQTKLWFKKPSSKFISFIKKESRQVTGKMVQFITGHCNLLKHQFRIGKNNKSYCRLCKQKDKLETPWHLVTECKELKNIREKLFQGQVLHSFSWSPQVLLRFCKESSIWSLLDGQD